MPTYILFSLIHINASMRPNSRSVMNTLQQPYSITSNPQKYLSNSTTMHLSFNSIHSYITQRTLLLHVMSLGGEEPTKMSEFSFLRVPSSKPTNKDRISESGGRRERLGLILSFRVLFWINHSSFKETPIPRPALSPTLYFLQNQRQRTYDSSPLS